MYKIPANTLFLGKNLISVPECHSTNDLAMEMSHQPSAHEGTVIVTDNQTAGRGQRGNTWKALPGMNLTFSVIFKPTALALKDQFYLNVFTSLGIYDYLRRKTDTVITIKWPNDVLADGKKLCGILIENQLNGNRISKSIVGIGLNINQSDFDIPGATSLCVVSGRQFQLPDALEELLACIEPRYLALMRGHYDQLRDDYLNVLHWHDQPRTFSSNGKEFNGIITGIDDIGRLIISADNGEMVFGEKEIVYVR